MNTRTRRPDLTIVIEVAKRIWDIARISPEHGNAVMDILGLDAYEYVADIARKEADDCFEEVYSMIMESDMIGSNKRGIAAALKPYMPNAYYRAVITVLNTDMFASSKRDEIIALGEKF